MSDADLKSTPLTAAHHALGGRMVAFAGYAMPVHYPLGILKEHLWTREQAGAFDVSHMGPAFLTLTEPTGDAEADHAAVAAIAETLVCGDIKGLKPGQLRYTVLLNQDGGLRDDLMIGRPFRADRQGGLYIVVNAGCKEADFAAFAEAAGQRARLTRADDRALIALQGPKAAAVLAEVLPDCASLTFMTFRPMVWNGANLIVARSGYTGEDGFEILVPASEARAFWDRLLADPRVSPVGLGARDSLRLEAGLPLYGHDADETTSPIEAGLAFAVAKRRRKARDFPGTSRIIRELTDGPSRMRIGLRVLEGAPAREGAEVTDDAGVVIGKVTSGGYAPSLGASIAMAYAPPAMADVGTSLKVVVRGKAQAAVVVAMPFVPHRYVR